MALPKTFGGRVRLRRDELGIDSQEDLAKLVRRHGGKISQQTVANIELDVVKTSRSLLPLSRALQTTPLWLMEGKGPKELREAQSTEVPLDRVIIIGEIQAGAFREAMEWLEDEWREAPTQVLSEWAHLPQRGLLVRGPSMNKFYPDGSTVVFVPWFDAGVEPQTGLKLIVHRRLADREGVEATVKELEIADDGTFWLYPRSTDPRYQTPWAVPSLVNTDDNDEIQIKSLVIASTRVEFTGRRST